MAPGLLSWPAWQALQAADHVVVASDGHPQRPAVEAAGIEVESLWSESAQARAPRAPRAPRDIADRLVALAAGGTVCLLADDAGTEALGAALAALIGSLADRGAAPELEVLTAAYDLPGARLLDVVAVMDRLRSPGGCPWDRAQTHASLVPYLVEEAYETVEAIETDDADLLREELGDLLLQVVFHARLGEEDAEAPWSVDDVAGGIVDKLVRRHPHVFADASASTAADVEASWEQLKQAEKGRASVMDGVPLAQPALALADKLLGRAERGGHARLSPDPPSGLATVDADTLGDHVLALVVAARAAGLDAEAALRAAARRFAARVRDAEAAAGSSPGARVVDGA